MALPVNPENISFLEELYQDWQADPSSVPREWHEYFTSLEKQDGKGSGAQELAKTGAAAGKDDYAYKQSRVNSLIWAYRDVGYIYASLNPLEGYMPEELWYVYKTIEGNYETLSLDHFGLEDADLDEVFHTSKFLDPPEAPLRDIIEVLKQTYCSYLGAEILHIQNNPIRKWLIRQIEAHNNTPQLADAQRKTVQEDLIKAYEFESFLGSQFIGQKRFSVEGSEVVVPALHYLIDLCARKGIEEIALGMSHRGRLNVLANILGKPVEQIFSKFEEHDESPTYGESGDVKYHLGYSKDHVNEDGSSIHVGLVANPSHLESVDPVVEGKTRGIQLRRGDKTMKKVVPVLLHGDAAFSGQGIVAETLNLSKLKGYETGGTIHIIVNNQIGFTTAARELRSTFFPTDVAKSLPIPIFHVNGDRPEYVIRAIDLAFAYRQKFGYDAIVDIFCYRKYGHNEADDPSFTHPIMYELINQSPGVTALYGNRLHESGVYPQKEQDRFRDEYREQLSQYLEQAREKKQQEERDGFKGDVWKQFQREYSHEPVETGIDEETLDHILSEITTEPEGFHVHPKLKRVLSRRAKMIEGEGGFDWATAEALAFGSLLGEGTSVRLSGEDSGRGTFSQRHAVWWDTETDEPTPYIPLNHLSEQQGKFLVHDSPLSELSVLGFEFGFSVAQPSMLVIWEAQFGDFCNGAQVIIDQFVASSEVKWDRNSGLVMLLPHGYEGQGPEHSSAFLERFLQLCAQDNIQVCNTTTPAQYFHLLRRQVKRDFRKPLIIMSPKSLLRHKAAVSPTKEFRQGWFREVLDDPNTNQTGNAGSEPNIDPSRVKTLVLCSGKIYYELAAAREEKAGEEVAILRMEQFYPFPEEQLGEVLGNYANAERLRWVQEEPQNRGGWRFMHEHLLSLQGKQGRKSLPIEYTGRPPTASPAPGSYRLHAIEQQRIIDDAFS
jgi:2-oxoglutarate dehydrogenase E1 component